MSVGTIFFSLFILTFIGFIVWSVIRSTVQAIQGWQYNRNEPVCAKCSYSVEGLKSWTCPECGANLLDVGILGRHQDLKRRDPFIEALAAWAALTAIPGVALGMWIANRSSTSSGLLSTLGSWLAMWTSVSLIIFMLRRRSLRRRQSRSTPPSFTRSAT